MSAHPLNENIKEVAPPRPKLPPEFEELVDTLMVTFNSQLKQMVLGHLVSIYIQGSSQMLSYGKTKLGFNIIGEGPPMSQAVNWARDYGAGLVTNMDIETRSRLAQVISDGIQNKRGVEGISRDLRKEFTDMSKTRADMISQTETNNALSQAAMDKMQEMGVDGKEWVVVGDDLVCEICNGNEADGVIPIDQPFSSGDMQPAGHVNCRCTLSPARLGRND